MPDNFRAHLRHAQFFKEQLESSEDQYLSGGDDAINGLSSFDLEWENIHDGHEWTAKNISSKEATKLCNSYSSVGAFCLDLRLNPYELIAWHETGIEAAKRLRDHISESIHYGNLGLAYGAIGEIDKAFECYQQQHFLAQENESRDLDAIAIGNLGVLYCELGEYEKSFQHLNKSFAYFRAQRDLQYQSILLGNLGNTFIDQGSVYEPLSFSDKLFDQVNSNTNLVNPKAAYALLEPKPASQENIENAIKKYTNSYELAKEIGDLRNEGSALGSLGFAYYLLGEIDRSLECLNEGLDLLSQIAFRKGEGVLLGFMGLAFKKNNNLDAALDAYERQLTIARELGSRDAGVALFHLGETYYRLGDSNSASKYFGEGVRFAQDWQLRFPRFRFNLISSSKKRVKVDAVKQFAWLLEQSKKYFIKAGFELNPEITTESGFAILTTQWNSHKQYGDILVQVFSGDLTGDNLIDLHNTSRKNNMKSPVSYAIYEDIVTDSAFFQMGAFRLGSNLTIVPIESSMIIESISLPRETIYTNLCGVEQKYLSHANPYDQSNAVTDPTLFFGRHSETDAVIKKLKKVEHVGIFGLRKIGKTSFLNHLKRRLNNEKIPVAYIGLQHDLTPVRLFEDILRQYKDFMKSLGVRNVPASKLLTVISEKKSDQIFREEILELSQLMQRQIGNSLLVIMVDEIERLVPSGIADSMAYRRFDNFFTPIRELSQTNRCLVSVVSGEKATIREEFPIGYSNTMFELYQPTYLAFFDYEECSDMVVKLGKLAGLQYTKESLDSVFMETGGHPYISRVLCSYIAEYRKSGKVTDKDVMESLQSTLETLNEYFKAWWLRTSEEEQEVVKMILNESNVSTMNFQYQEALQRLKQHGIVSQSTGKAFFIAPHLLRRWLLQRGMDQYE